ncbi:MAG: ABC transporter permease [Opitutae bacterium]|nr:ABC transporter permease [Opitutae bacterium]
MRLLLPVLAAPLLLGVWYGAFLLFSPEQRLFLPAPHQIFHALIANHTELFSAALNTGAGALAGFVLAIVVSSFCALLLSLSPWVRASFYPYLMILQMTPVIVLAPILIIWVGAGFKSVTVITFLICVFPLVVNSTQGLISVDSRLVELFRMARASRWQEVFVLRVPAALPYFFTGLRIAATLAPIGAVVGDFTAGNSARAGLGFLTIIYSANFRYPELFATVVTTCALGFFFTGGVIWLSWLALHHWHDSYGRSDN